MIKTGSIHFSKPYSLNAENSTVVVFHRFLSQRAHFIEPGTLEVSHLCTIRFLLLLLQQSTPGRGFGQSTRVHKSCPRRRQIYCKLQFQYEIIYIEIQDNCEYLHQTPTSHHKQQRVPTIITGCTYGTDRRDISNQMSIVVEQYIQQLPWYIYRYNFSKLENFS